MNDYYLPIVFNWIIYLTMQEDRVNYPSHYTWLKQCAWIEAIDITRHFDFNIWNALKYLIRSWHKSEWGMSDIDKQIEDLEKAKRYITDYINNILIPMKNNETI